ncbi:MAG: SoxR reducing system RseC family protein [Pseudomonadota bacterium]
MATEKGIVTRIDGDRAWVRTLRSGACEACCSSGACHGSGDRKEMEVEALNDVGAVAGDQVQIRFDSGKLMGISFFLYIFPVLMLIAGSVLGQKMAQLYQLSESTASALGGFGFFGLAFLVIRWGGSALAGKKGYQPRIAKIVTRG